MVKVLILCEWGDEKGGEESGTRRSSGSPPWWSPRPRPPPRFIWPGGIEGGSGNWFCWWTDRLLSSLGKSLLLHKRPRSEQQHWWGGGGRVKPLVYCTILSYSGAPFLLATPLAG
jgi:hypothetical protein